MGQKDITQKKLEAYNDVFSDIVNGLLFEGRPVVLENELEEQAPRTYYKEESKYRQLERDVVKRWVKENVRIACIGLENQSKPDEDMPLRVLAYDGTDYRAQLNNKEKRPRYPVLTLVLYFGLKPWDKAKTLYEALNIPEELKPFINDYKMNLYEIAFLPREQVNRFKSDFRIVADYFVQKRETNNYIPDPEQMRHVQETLDLLKAMAEDPRFEEVLDQKKGTVKNMCEVLDRIEKKGRIEGRIEGRKAGRRAGRREGRKEGHAAGQKQGLKEGKNSVSTLMRKMFAENRMGDLQKAAENPEYMDELLKQYHLDK